MMRHARLAFLHSLMRTATDYHMLSPPLGSVSQNVDGELIKAVSRKVSTAMRMQAYNALDEFYVGDFI